MKKNKKKAPQGHVFLAGKHGCFLAPKKAEIQKNLGSNFGLPTCSS